MIAGEIMTMPPEMRVLAILFAFVAIYFATQMARWWERLGISCLSIALMIAGVQSAFPAALRAKAPINIDRIGMILLWLCLLTMGFSIGSDIRDRLRRRSVGTS
jgi:hypothetical protein